MGQPGTATPLHTGVLWYRVAAFLVTFAAAWGSLVGRSCRPSRQPARASAPAANLFLGGLAVGLNVHAGTPSLVPPVAGVDTVATSPPPLERGSDGQLAAATGGPSLVAAALQPAGAW